MNCIATRDYRALGCYSRHEACGASGNSRRASSRLIGGDLAEKGALLLTTMVQGLCVFTESNLFEMYRLQCVTALRIFRPGDRDVGKQVRDWSNGDSKRRLGDAANHLKFECTMPVMDRGMSDLY